MSGSGPEPVQARLLGDPEVAVGASVVRINAGQQQALFVALALARGRAVPADRLVDALWGASPPASAQASLRGLMARLRRCLGKGADVPWLSGRGAGYVLDLPAAAIDAEQFADLAASGRAALAAGDLVVAATAFATALDLWRGPAFGQVADLEFARAAARQLDEGRLDVVESLAEVELASGRLSSALGRLEPHVAAHPLREQACGQLMRALYRSGRQADALAAYQRVRERLADELGIDPSPALRDLELAILRQRPELDPARGAIQFAQRDFGEIARCRGNLPSPLTPFVGRIGEIDSVLEAMRRSRIVTLAGPGGSGKTRLALETASRIQGENPDGAWFADLAPLRDPDLVAPAIAAAIGLDAGALTSGGRPFLDALCEQLRHRRLLLVIDNCEQIVEAAARVARAILLSCPQVTVLATSRELLGVAGETVMRLKGLSLPPALGTAARALAESDAVALFCARAADSTPGFALSDGNAAAVARICHRLDGLPLALELAAARLRLLGARALADRLDDRFHMLAAGPRTADPRHRTLEAALDWSHDLLSEVERVALRRVSFFPASWTLPAAQATVAKGADGLDGPAVGEVIDIVARLVDKSLVVSIADDSADEPRYRLLETVRAYGSAKLEAAGEADLVRHRHRAHLIASVEGWVQARSGESWLRWVRLEIDNFRAALVWSAARGDDWAVLALAPPLWTFWQYTGSIEAVGWLERAVAAPPDGAVAAAVHARMGLAAILRNARGGDSARAEPLLREAIELALEAGDEESAAWARFGMADLAASRGQFMDVLALVDDRTAETRISRGSIWRVHTAAVGAWVPMSTGDWNRARSMLDEAIELMVDHPDSYLVAHLLGQRALLEAAAGNPSAARAAADAAVAQSRGFPGSLILAMGLIRAAEAALLCGETERATTFLVELLSTLRDLGARRWVSETLEVVAVVLAPSVPRSAALCFGAAEALRVSLGEERGMLPLLSVRVAEAIRAVHSDLGAEAESEARRQGADLRIDEVLDFARIELEEL